MPHITLEYSSNLDQDVDFDGLFAQIHSVLADEGGLKIGNCKSRATKVGTYYIGDGADNYAFVHADVRFLEGRSVDAKQQISGSILAILKDCYASSLETWDLQITVEVRDISKETYSKVPAGTLEYP